MSLGKYTDRLKRRGACEPSFCYLMDTLLQSRIATHHESNKEYFDEDVNVYLALLLNSMVSDRFHKIASRYVVPREIDLPGIMERTASFHTKHEIYRTNGDYLLLQSGLFRLPARDEGSRFDLAATVERGRTYYRLACSIASRIPEHYRATSEVLAKLAYDFEKYRKILSHMRGEFLGLIEPVPDRELRHLYEDMDEFELEDRIKAYQDKLLDAYLGYRRKGSEANRRRLAETLDELKALDPNVWPGLRLQDLEDERRREN